MSLDLRDAYHTLPLVRGFTEILWHHSILRMPYIGLLDEWEWVCPVVPALWQQFVHIIWEELAQ